MKRRDLLLATTASLAAQSLHNLLDLRPALAQAQAAKRGGRKFALLVGISEYQPGGNRILADLPGCVQDVLLQKYLLHYRYGFPLENIRILTNAQATRKGILQAFEQHLIAQAQPGDILVFAFSGHGSRVQDAAPIRRETDNTLMQSNSSFIPYDATRITAKGEVDDIMGKTLFLLTALLKTDRVTLLLDSCHSGGGTRGQAIARTEGAFTGQHQPSRQELEYQTDLLNRKGWTTATLKQQRQKGPMGIVLAAAHGEQDAQDFVFQSGFRAGAFTWLLTQALWEQNFSVSDMAIIETRVKQLTDYQIPQFHRAATLNRATPIFFTPPQRPFAQAVVTATQGQQATLWLGGFDHTIQLQPDSTFATIDEKGRETGLVTVRHREGLTAKADVVSGIVRPGTLLRERDRVIPNDLIFKIGLDPSLKPDWATLQSLLRPNARVEFIPLPSRDATAIAPLDGILSRVLPEDHQRHTDLVPNSIAFFSASLSPIPSPAGTATEAIAAALNRLEAVIRSQVATKLTRQILNPTTTTLNLSAQIVLTDRPATPLAQVSTKRGSSSTQLQATLPLNRSYTIQITNQESVPLHLLLLRIGSKGDFEAVFPNRFFPQGDNATAPSLLQLEQVMQVPPQSQSLVPASGQDYSLRFDQPSQDELIIIASRQPLAEAYQNLDILARETNQAIFGGDADRSRSAISNLFGAIGTRTASGVVISNTDLATLSIALKAQ